MHILYHCYLRRIIINITSNKLDKEHSYISFDLKVTFIKNRISLRHFKDTCGHGAVIFRKKLRNNNKKEFDESLFSAF